MTHLLKIIKWPEVGMNELKTLCKRTLCVACGLTINLGERYVRNFIQNIIMRYTIKV